MTITPKICLELLKYNENNRPQKPKKIAEYENYMMAGEWMLTGDTIKFSNAKLLRDGQNRLKACERAGVPFRTHIVFGIDDEAFDRLNQGKNRNGADVLSIAGYQYVAALSGAVRWTHLIENRTGQKPRQLHPGGNSAPSTRALRKAAVVCAARQVYLLDDWPANITRHRLVVSV
jgi:hypothetical protein